MSPRVDWGDAPGSRFAERRGWIVVIGAFVTMFVTFGVAYSFSPFFVSLEQTFHASRRAISLVFSIAVPLYFFLGAVSGPLADRLGARRVCASGTVIGGLGLIYAARAHELWQVYVGFGIGVGVGVGFSYVPSIAAVQQWFDVRRGLASGIAVSGIGVGTLAMPLVAAALIDWIGWRGAWSTLGAMVIVVGGGATVLIKNAPGSENGLRSGAAGRPAMDLAGVPQRDVSVSEAVTSRPFVLLYLGLVSISIGAFTPFVHLMPFAEDNGVAHRAAVVILSLVGVGSTVGRFLLGGTADRIGRRRSLVGVFGGLAVMQLWWLASTTAWQLAVFAMVFGTFYGGFVAIYPALTVDHFGNRYASGIIGILYTGCTIGTFIGPLLAGAAFDALGSYTLPIAVGAAFALVAMTLVLFTPEPATVSAPKIAEDGQVRV
jgi:MFS transporter, OFA family, oxalate/formate antiporter